MTLSLRVAELVRGPRPHPGLDEQHAMNVLGYARRADHPWLRRRAPRPLTHARLPAEAKDAHDEQELDRA